MDFQSVDLIAVTTLQRSALTVEIKVRKRVAKKWNTVKTLMNPNRGSTSAQQIVLLGSVCTINLTVKVRQSSSVIFSCFDLYASTSCDESKQSVLFEHHLESREKLNNPLI